MTGLIRRESATFRTTKSRAVAFSGAPGGKKKKTRQEKKEEEKDKGRSIHRSGLLSSVSVIKETLRESTLLGSVAQSEGGGES